MICKLSKKGTTPSQIGVILRDHHGVGRVTSVTGTKILRILRKQGLAPEIPEDLYFMIKKAVSMRKHLEVFRKDRDAKFRLILVESRIHRLARYYKVRCGAGIACMPRAVATVLFGFRLGELRSIAPFRFVLGRAAVTCSQCT